MAQCTEGEGCPLLEPAPVQILVVVATIQVQGLKA